MTLQLPIYLDNHATTRVDPRVVTAMLPYWTEQYGNPGSTTHSFGWEAREAVQQAREQVAQLLNVQPSELIWTSGATESNNLAIQGIARRQSAKRHLVSVRTEHKAVLDPLKYLSQQGYSVTLLDVQPAGQPRAGYLDPQSVLAALRPETCLVSVMLANNEIGVWQDLATICELCHTHGVLVHCDATQAIGKLNVDVRALGVDLLSLTAHKFYGPKGCGALFVRRQGGPVRLEPQLFGGGQEQGYRSGTLNVPGIVGLAKALQLCHDEMSTEPARQRQLRDHLYQGLQAQIPQLRLNGPALEPTEWRLPGNLNVTFEDVHGESLIMRMQQIAVSSGSACTSANPEPSHVLKALGLSEDLTRASLRFGIGRFNTREEIDYTITTVAAAVKELRTLSSMA